MIGPFAENSIVVEVGACLDVLAGMPDGCVEGELCQRCRRQYVLVWDAPDDLWATVSGHPQGNGLLCPDCFDELAREGGIFLHWECKKN